jgi:ubiquinone biosynthesis protein UbiJ
MARGDMRFTIEQRLGQLERENVVLHDTTKLLHQMLKDQQQLIKDYITQMLVSTDESEVQTGRVRAEQALYTSTCKQRFDRLEQTIEKLHNKQAGESALALSSI